ncbi:MAG: hypothetical protein R3190_10570 [Thermoanaerobaculia bacterium]|nr:hypothetical protein [Thermoanaerobaculia bacterium]
MRRRAPLVPILLVVAAVSIGSTEAAAAAVGRTYKLYTLDHRIAAALIVDLCSEARAKPDECRVQGSDEHGIAVLATYEIHDRITRMLAERDIRLPASLTYQLVLVRARSAGGGAGIGDLAVAAHVRKALEGARELLSLRSFELLDQGLVHISDSGSTRLKGPGGRRCVAFLSHRGAVTNDAGAHITLGLEIGTEASDDGPAQALLESVLTLQEGETVVAGTSSIVPGDSVLLVILTSLEL